MVWNENFDENFKPVEEAIEEANKAARTPLTTTTTPGTVTATTTDPNETAKTALSNLSKNFSEKMKEYTADDKLLSKEEEEEAKKLRDEYGKRIGALLDNLDNSVKTALQGNIEDEQKKITSDYYDKNIEKDFNGKLHIAEGSKTEELVSNFAKLYHSTDKKTITKEDVISKFNEKLSTLASVNVEAKSKLTADFKSKVIELAETEKEKRDAEDLFYKLDKNDHIKVEKDNEQKEQEYKKSKPWLYHDSLSKEQESYAKKEYLEDKSIITNLSKTKIAALENLEKRIERAKKYKEQANDAIKDKFGTDPIYTQKDFDKAYKDKKKEKDQAERQKKMYEKRVENRLNKLIGNGGLTKKDVTDYINASVDDKKGKFGDIYKKLELSNDANKIKRSLVCLGKDYNQLQENETKLEKTNETLKKYDTIKEELPQLYNDHKTATKDLAKAYGDKATKVDKYIAKYEKEAKVIIDKEQKKIKELDSGSMIGRNLGVGKVSLQSLETKKDNARKRREKLEARAASWDITGISEWRANRLAEREEKLNTRIDGRKEEIDLRNKRVEAVKTGKKSLTEIKTRNQESIEKAAKDEKDEQLKKRLLQDPSIPKEIREQLAGKGEELTTKASNFASRMKKRFSSPLPGAKYNTGAKTNKPKESSHSI